MKKYNFKPEVKKVEEPVEVEKPAEVLEPVEVKSSFNCADCKGDGLLDERTRCPKCLGTGKV